MVRSPRPLAAPEQLREDALEIGQRAVHRQIATFAEMRAVPDGSESHWKAFSAATDAVRRFNEYASAAAGLALCPICWIESGQKNLLLPGNGSQPGHVECCTCGYETAAQG